MQSGRRVRVVRVITRLNVGGPAIHATLLTEHLDPRRYESVLVAGAEGPAEGNYLALYGGTSERLERIPALGREIHGWQDASALSQLLRLMRRVRPHIVHTHMAKAGTLGRVAALVTGVPVIVHTYHGHVLRGYFSSMKARLFLAIERWLARRTHRLLAVSETVRAELLAMRIGAPARVTVMPLGLELDRFSACEALRGQLRRELNVADAGPLVGIVARLVPVKAHEVFLQAATLIARRDAEVHFVLVGDGERRAELGRLTERLGLGGRVHFLGWRRDLERIYADLDVVVLSSRNEGSPVALIEAMAAGRPVVATRVGGVPDVVEDGVTGCLVPSQSPAAMADAIGALLADPERRRAMGRAGRARVLPRFGAARLLDDVDRLYCQLVHERLGWD